MPDEIPQLQPEPRRRSLWQRVSLLWLVPLTALVVALGVAWQTWSSQGPVIVITFEEALGVKPRETELKYRDVPVGRVEKVKFTEDLGRVEVSIRVGKHIAPFIDTDAAFWVVRPEVTTRGVSGLDTVLSGVFVEGVWDTTPGGFVREHSGRESAPLLRPGIEGTEVLLRALPGVSPAEGTAITYKGIEVGRVGKPRIGPGSDQVSARAVIFAPHDRLLSSTSRFWDTSGFTFTLGAGGAGIDFTSLASLISGGIAFETLVSGGTPIAKGHVFDLYPSESDARNAVFERDRRAEAVFAIIFDENVSGLAVGSPVQFNGINVGEVTEISGFVNSERFGDERVRLQVLISISAEPLGLLEVNSPKEMQDFLDDQIQTGLRARLATASLLTGGLRVELITLEDKTPVTLDRSATPFPAIPTTTNVIADAGATVQGVLQRVNDLPVEELMASAVTFLTAATELVSNDNLSELPQDLRDILGDLRGVTSAPELLDLPAQVSEILSDLKAASAGVQILVASIEQAEAIERLLGAIDSAGAAAQRVSDSTAGVPELIDSLTETARTARDLPLEALISRITETVDLSNALLAAPGTKDLPVTLSASLEELRLALRELREGGAVQSLNATLNSTQEAAAAVEAATQALPAITQRLDAALLAANQTFESFDAQSEFNRTARQALTELARAAKAVESLARTLDRRPNSILLGK
jgi:paraquat-inducible protein B